MNERELCKEIENRLYYKYSNTNQYKQNDLKSLTFLLDYSILNGYISNMSSDEGEKNKNLDRAGEVLASINNLLPNINLGPSVWYGYSGIGYLATFLSNNGERYSKFLTQVNQVIIDHTLFLLKNYWRNGRITVRYYDLFHGASGIGRYLLNYKDQPSVRIILEELIDFLIELSKSSQIEKAKLNGYFIEKENILNPSYINTFPNGYLDLGLSHGLAAPLTFLSLAYKEGIILPGQKNAIKNLLTIYKKNVFEENEMLLWPRVIGADKKENNITFSRPSWCYGSLGIARSLHIASSVVMDEEAEAISIKVLLGLIKKDPDDLGFICPSFCHGYSGPMLIYNLFYKDTKLKQFKLYSNNIKKKILSYKKDSHMYLFRKYDNDKYLERIQESDSTSLLDGALSVLIPLIISNNEYNADDIFSQMVMLN